MTAGDSLRVILPYTGTRNPEVERALAATRQIWAAVDVGGSDRAYFDLLSELWAEGDDFYIVEHDVTVHPTALAELSACPSDWCGFPHEYAGYGLQWGLGCVKFGADLIARNPDAMLRVGVMKDATHSPRHWCRLDAWLQGCVLPSTSEEKCRHETAVGHLGNGCAHGCIPTA